MFVKLRSWIDKPSRELWGFSGAVAPFVTFDRGSPSLREDWEDMLCRASIVDEGGGVFSPRMLWVAWRRGAGRTIGVKLGPGADGAEEATDSVGVQGRLEPCSIIQLRSRTLPGCSDCMRRWVPPLTSALSGEPSRRRPELWVLALSRARSLRAAWAFWIALEVPVREVSLGDCGLSGRGGGARSGSELSHLLSCQSLDRQWRCCAV